MDENLQRLIQELRTEKCPPRVFESVAKRRARRPAPLRRLRTANAVAVVCIAALLAAILVERRPNRNAVSPTQAFASHRAQQVRVAGEAVAALDYIGNVLLEAGKHTQNILLNETVPPLRSGLEAVGKTIKNKI
jgi:anti-sigma factor RsiW